MSKKRRQYKDSQSELTVFSVSQSFSLPVNEQIVPQVLSRLEHLFDILVLQTRLLCGGKFLHLVLGMPTRELTEEEARIRCVQYDATIMDTGYAATDTSVAVPPKKLYREHAYRAETLRSISAFMHDAMWAICWETWTNAGSRKAANRPKTNGKFTMTTIDLGSLPRLYGKEGKRLITRKLQACGFKMKVRLCQPYLKEAERIIGNEPFVLRMLKDNYKGELEEQQIKEKIHPLRIWSESDMYRFHENRKAAYKMLQKIAVGRNICDDLKDELLEVMEKPHPSISELDKTVCFTPAVLFLWLCSKAIFVWKRKHLLTDDKLEKLWEEAGKEAHTIS